MELVSISNSQQTLLRKLNRKKYRYKKRLFLLEGARAVQQVIENGAITVKRLFFDETQQYWEQEYWRKATDKLAVATLTRPLFAEVTDTDTPQGVLALCEMPNEISVDELAAKQGIIVALDALQDPGNLGSIIRTASWFDIAGIICGRGTVDLFHPKVVRGTAGATGTVPFMNAELSEVFDTLERYHWQTFLLDASAEALPMDKISSIKKAVVVVGNEGHGINEGLYTDNRIRMKIPAGNRAQVESLNAAVAASIVLYDFSAKRG